MYVIFFVQHKKKSNFAVFLPLKQLKWTDAAGVNRNGPSKLNSGGSKHVVLISGSKRRSSLPHEMTLGNLIGNLVLLTAGNDFRAVQKEAN